MQKPSDLEGLLSRLQDLQDQFPESSTDASNLAQPLSEMSTRASSFFEGVPRAR